MAISQKGPDLYLLVEAQGAIPQSFLDFNNSRLICERQAQT